ncbi:portal protein, partial [Bacillus sp. D-CC]
MEFCACCTRSMVADESGDLESWRVGCFGGAMTCAFGAAIKTIKDQEKHDRSAWSKIVDNTGKDSLKTLAAGMVSGTCSPSRKWFTLQAADE